MTGLRTFWRRVGGLTAVLLVFALMLAPAAEAAACGNEAPAAVAQQVMDQAVAASGHVDVAPGANGKAAPDVGDDLGLCQHGHCHHTASYLPTLMAEPAVYAAALTPAVKLKNQHARSRAPSRLERPPRA